MIKERLIVVKSGHQSCSAVTQGIIDMNWNGNSANFFSYVCNSKKIKELFAFTLDRIPISVKCVSFMIFVLNLNLPYYLRRTQTKNTARTEEVRLSAPCFAS